MSERRVVVTGLGWATSLGRDLDTVWQDLLAGRSGIGPIERWDATEHTARIAGELSHWDGSPHIDPQRAKRLDRFAQFALSSAIDAVADAGLQTDRLDPWRCGVIIGSGIGGMESFETGTTRYRKRAPNAPAPS
jgi:3-oxoacyl-[acyl-carrier-protein] synthase II